MLKPSPFLEQVVEEYFRARALRVPHKKVWRGESRSVASDAEDLFAVEVANSFPAIGEIFVNQTLTSCKGKSDGRLKPDLVICKDKEIRLLIDLKMDLGYKRHDFLESASKRALLIQSIRGKDLSFWKKEPDSREQRNYRLSKDAVYAYVVITDSNIAPADYQDISDRVGLLPQIRMFTLVRGSPVNLYKMSVGQAKAQVLQHASTNDFMALTNLFESALR